MNIVVHRGTHQIGGVATELRTEKTRIIIDMGEELCSLPTDTTKPLSIPGVTDKNGSCDAVFFTHFHGDHTGLIGTIRDDIPIYMGQLTKDILLATRNRYNQANTDERRRELFHLKPCLVLLRGARQKQRRHYPTDGSASLLYFLAYWPEIFASARRTKAVLQKQLLPCYDKDAPG